MSVSVRCSVIGASIVRAGCAGYIASGLARCDMKLGVLEAKNRLSELLDRAVAGEEVVITRRGEPEVVLTPLRKTVSREEAEAEMALWDDLRARYRGPIGTTEETKADINFGRRF